jgi:pimeloyl-ACP methyl ester carboxylesterase
MQTRETLFLLPGLLCDEMVWEHQQAALSPFADIVIPVFRGFDSLKSMAESVLAQAPERFSIVGHSMGGRVAMEIMHLAGNRIDKIAVLDTGTHGVKRGENQQRQEMLDLADSDGLQAVADAWIPIMIHSARHEDQVLVQAMNEMILRNTVDEYKGQVNALLSRVNQSEYLSDIKQHVLLICGDEDIWCPVSQHEVICSDLTRANLIVVKDSGHMSTIEKPQEVSEILVNWFTGNHE